MFEARYGRPHQFVHDRWIIKCKCTGKNPVAYNSMGLGRRRDNDHCRHDQPLHPTAGMGATSDQNAPDRLLLPSRGGTRPTRVREHEDLMPHLKTCARPNGPVRDSSDQRHGFWWTLGKTRLSSGERDRFGDDGAHAHEVSRRGIEDVWKRPGQRMQRTALIVQIK